MARFDGRGLLEFLLFPNVSYATAAYIISCIVDVDEVFFSTTTGASCCTLGAFIPTSPPSVRSCWYLIGWDRFDDPYRVLIGHYVDATVELTAKYYLFVEVLLFCWNCCCV